MSGDILEKQPNSTPEATDSASAPAVSASAPAGAKALSTAVEASPSSPDGREVSPRKSLFGNLNTDLKQALNSWETLTEEMTNKISPDEEQLLEVKRLLSELKSKLNQFDE